MTDDLERLNGEIHRLRQEAAAVTRLPPTIAERFAQTEAELRQAEQLYRERGLGVSAGHPTETTHLQRQALVGLCMVVGADKILKAEHARIEAQGEGLSEREKTGRLAQLRRQIERLCAQRELQLREREAPGEFLPRPTLHAEMVVFRKPDLERLVR